MYCGTICQQNELKGYRPVLRGIRYYKALMGIKKDLCHKTKRAKPMTTDLLTKIHKVVDFSEDIELVVWIAMVTGFHLILHKSNLVPLSRVHDTVHNIAHSDVWYKKGVMVIMIRWSKTNQCGESIQEKTMVANNNKLLCPVRWILYMADRIPALPQHNLFCFRKKQNTAPVPITYRDLMTKMRKWLELVGVKDTGNFSSHSLRRGATAHARNQNISENAIMQMGGWKSQCYRKYIDIGVNAQIQAWNKFTKY